MTGAFVLAVGAPPVSAAPLDGIDAYADAVRARFEVPGIAIAVVKDGRVVLERGYGVRTLGAPAPVDAHTLFAIASNTKAFTATALAMLVDEKKLAWDDRVVDRLPWFQMSDAYVTREMRVNDLLVHRSGLGLGAGDLLFWPATTYTTEEVVRRLRDVPIANPFRSRYAYDNVLYAVAGLTIEQVSGRSWGEFVRERIFKPVGMSESKVNCTELRDGDNVASGHAKFDFTELRTVPPMAWDNNSAAGGIYSNVHDMAKWIAVQLDGGRLPGEAGALFDPARQREMWSVSTPMPIADPPVPELAPAVPQFQGYGYGWVLSDYRGHKLVSHTGGWPGMVSRVTLLPELKLGVVVLTNQEVGAAFQALTLRVLDDYLGAPATDWIGAYAAALDKLNARADEGWAKHVAARDPRSRPSLALDRYAGTYRDPWYGDVAITREGKRLAMRFGKTAQLVGDLEHWQQDTFIVRWRDRSLNADAFVNFALDPDGRVSLVRMQAISSRTDFSFDFHDLRLTPVAP